MSDGPILGIDLGTTNSVVAVADGGQARVLTDVEGRRIVPSVVSFRPDGRILVGYEARERRLIDAANTVYAVKRLIGRPFDSPEVERARARFAFEIVPNKHGGSVVKVRRGTYALAEISAMVLRELKRVAEDALGVPCERAVVTVPANFNELQRSATQAAGKVAGLDVLRILNEPTAAALAYGHGAQGTEKVAVYDLGGGTFDVTILELESDVFEVLATGGDTFLGGEDLDLAVAEAMADACAQQHGWDPREDPQAFERLKAASEWAKCQLSDQDAIDLTIEELGPLAVDLDFEMTRLELEALAEPWLQQTFAVCQEALRTAGLAPRDLDRVVLVGGSTRMPLCRQRVAEYFDATPRTDLDPDMVVAQGAAIHGYALGGPNVQVPPLQAARKRTRAGMSRGSVAALPRQPAFAPPELPIEALPPPRQERPSAAAPPLPDLPAPSRPPGPPVVPGRMVAVDSLKSTMDAELDGLAPPEGELDSLMGLFPDAAPEPLDDLWPAELTAVSAEGLGAPEQGAAPPPAPALPTGGQRGQRPIPSREPTAPFSVGRSAARPPPPPARAVRPPPIPTAAGPTLSASAGLALDPSTWDIPAELSAPPAPVLAMPDSAVPLLMDVTPHSLGIETVGGYCRKLIAKNAPLPTEQTRRFTTAGDGQVAVAVRICQGEADTFVENEILGEVLLDNLPAGPRGSVQIEVAFILDASGVLSVEALDVESKRAQRTRISLRGGLTEADVATMRSRLEAERADE